MEKRRMEARNGASNGENNQRRKRRVSGKLNTMCAEMLLMESNSPPYGLYIL